MNARMKTALAALAVSMSAATAEAAVVININEENGGVRFSYNGTIDLTGLGASDGNVYPTRKVFDGSDGGLLFIDSQVAFWKHEGVTFDPFGSKYVSFQGEIAGDLFAIFSDDAFGLPAGYVSGTTISGSLFEANTDFTTLGLITGIYETSLPNDTITLRIGQGEVKSDLSAVPLPATLPLLIAGLGGLAVFRSRKS